MSEGLKWSPEVLQENHAQVLPVHYCQYAIEWHNANRVVLSNYPENWQ